MFSIKDEAQFDYDYIVVGRRFAVLRCPVVDQMVALLPEQDARDLCVITWCAQNFPTAEMWGGRLEPRGTIAGGAGRCDFHFIGD